MIRLLIAAVVSLGIAACGLPRDIVGPTDPRGGPAEQPPRPGN